MYNKTEQLYKTTSEKSLSWESLRSMTFLRGQKVMHRTPCRSPVGSGSAVRWRVKDQKLKGEPDQNYAERNEGDMERCEENTRKVNKKEKLWKRKTDWKEVWKRTLQYLVVTRQCPCLGRCSYWQSRATGHLESSTGSAAAQYHCLYCPEPSAARHAPETRLPVAAENKQE